MMAAIIAVKVGRYEVMYYWEFINNPSITEVSPFAGNFIEIIFHSMN